MRLFYILKSIQIFLGLSALILIITSTELCSRFISNEMIVEQLKYKNFKTGKPIYVGAMMEIDSQGSRTRLGKFFGEILSSWDSLWEYDPNNPDPMSEVMLHNEMTDQQEKSGENKRRPPSAGFINKVSTTTTTTTDRPKINLVQDTETFYSHNVPLQNNSGLATRQYGIRQCLSLHLREIFQTHSQKHSTQDSIDNYVGRLQVPLCIIIFYLVIVVAHLFFAEPSTYQWPSILGVAFSVLAWFWVLLQMLYLFYNWHLVWQNSDFKPEMPLFVGIVGTIAFFLSSLGPVEAIYNEKLLKELVVEDQDYYYNDRFYDNSFDIDQWSHYR